MKKELREAYHNRILEEALKRYGASEGGVQSRGGFESYVFEYEKQGKPHILKITHSSRRTAQYVEGELEWLHYLGDNGMNVCRSVLSDAHRYIEQIPWEDGYFLAAAYEKAPGKPLQRDDWNDDTFRKWGRYVGRMHALTKSYRVSDPAYKRLEWHEEDQLNLRKYVPDDQSLVFERMDAILARISKLPKDNDSYGLIHTDLHHGNFYLHEGRIFAFDFDDACYDWFIRDIANILYNVLWFPVEPIDHKAEFARRFMRSFLEGYREENKIDASWLALIPDFLILRRVFLYGVFHESRDLANMDAWEVAMFAEYRQEIENETPVVELDIDSMISHMAQ